MTINDVLNLMAGGFTGLLIGSLLLLMGYSIAFDIDSKIPLVISVILAKILLIFCIIIFYIEGVIM